MNSNAIAATIHQTQTLTAGSTVKLRLRNDIYLNGILIPKGNFVFGLASVEHERLLIDVPCIRYKNHLLPVSLKVYDMDDLVGIYVPGSISKDAVKSSADQSLQSIKMMVLDPSLKAQAASAGVQTVKGLLSKRSNRLRLR